VDAASDRRFRGVVDAPRTTKIEGRRCCRALLAFKRAKQRVGAMAAGAEASEKRIGAGFVARTRGR